MGRYRNKVLICFAPETIISFQKLIRKESTINYQIDFIYFVTVYSIMMILFKHFKHIKMFHSSGESQLGLDYKVGIVLKAYCCVKLALLEDNSIFHRVLHPNEPLPGAVYMSFIQLSGLGAALYCL